MNQKTIKTLFSLFPLIFLSFLLLFQGVYKNNANLFTVKNQAEFIDGSTDGIREISSYSQEEFNKLNNFYQENVHKTTSYNSDGTLRNANKAFAKENETIIDYISKHPGSTLNDAIRNFIPNTVEAIANTPDTIKGAGNYIDAVLPTTNQDRLDTLYGSHTDGSVLQANLHTADVISTAGMAVGGSSLVKGGAKSINKALDESVDESLGDVKINPLDGTETSIEEVRSTVSTAKSYQSKEPRTLEEQLTIKEVEANPEIGRKIGGEEKRFNNDPLFHRDDGFQKMSYIHEGANGENIEVHYQYHEETGKVYDIKIEDKKLKKEFQGVKK